MEEVTGEDHKDRQVSKWPLLGRWVLGPPGP